MRMEKLLMCAICKFTTGDTNKLLDHIDECHKCSVCGQTFFRKQFHNCTFDEEEAYNHTGTGESIEIPSDASNRPIFKQTGSAFKNIIAVYEYDYDQTEVSDITEGVELIIVPLEQLIKQYISIHKGLRLKLTFEILFYSNKEKQEVTKRYPSFPLRITHVNFIYDTILDCAKYVSKLSNLLSHEISGLTILRLLKLQISLVKYSPVLSEGYLPLSKHLSGRHGLLNIRTHNKECFNYSIAACLYYKMVRDKEGNNLDTAKGKNKQAIRKRLEREKTFDKFVENLSFREGHYGDNLEDLDTFEAVHDISVSIVRFCTKSKDIVPLRLTKVMKNRHVFLLMIYRKHLPVTVRHRYSAKYHYVAIINIKAFMACGTKKYAGVCRFCYSFYRDTNHETQCFENDFIGIQVPKNDYFQNTDLHRLVIPPTFFVYQLLFSGSKQKDPTVVAYSLIGLNSEFKIIFSQSGTGPNSLNAFFDALLMNAYYYLDENSKNQIPLCRTEESDRELKKVTHCYICGVEVSKSNPAVRHHDHHGCFNGESRANFVRGQAKSYPCSFCNLKIKGKKQIPVFGYNLSYHVKPFLRHISKLGINNIKLTPLKTADSVCSIVIENKIQLIDLCNHFNDQSLHRIMSVVSTEDLHFLKDHAKDEHEFALIRHGLPFPLFSDGSLPPIEDFKDIRYLNEFGDDEYNRVEKAYEHFQCKDLLEYGKLAVEVDAYSMCSLIVNYAKFCIETFGANPLWDTTLSGFAYAVMHIVSKSNYQNLKDGRIIRILEEYSYYFQVFPSQTLESKIFTVNDYMIIAMRMLNTFGLIVGSSTRQFF